MKRFTLLFILLIGKTLSAQQPLTHLGYHNIQKDNQGVILPWYTSDFGTSADHVILGVWNFWDRMRSDPNGLPYYMNHQVWKRDFNDARGIGGDQLAMAMSSWRLLYAYTGNERMLNNIRFMADYYLSHALSPSNCLWRNLPFPYNTLVYSGIYDGDMIDGKGFTQPDKAGSFGFELVNLYRMTDKRIYLEAAIDIANSLAEHQLAGDENHSPWPFRVNVYTGKVGSLKDSLHTPTSHTYTTNWVGTLNLYASLSALNEGQPANYNRAFQQLLTWMKRYPLKNNKWGPFFEDVGEWSDTQINAVTFAQYILEHPQYFDQGALLARGILDWVYHTLGNPQWSTLGVSVVNEQTSYRVPGNSHTARQGAAEILYSRVTGDVSVRQRGIHQLIWATYMVSDEGENTYPNGETWLTDGFGDYVRHYLRAMAFDPELAPQNQNHLLSTTSIIRSVEYDSTKVVYRTADLNSTEILRLRSKPVSVGCKELQFKEGENKDDGNYWSWKELGSDGILSVSHRGFNRITVLLKE